VIHTFLVALVMLAIAGWDDVISAALAPVDEGRALQH
jgi:hypothetical protein